MENLGLLAGIIIFLALLGFVMGVFIHIRALKIMGERLDDLEKKLLMEEKNKCG